MLKWCKWAWKYKEQTGLNYLVSRLSYWRLFFIFSGKAHAATFNAAAGNDSVENNDDICQLSEAIYNINDQATTYDDCVPIGSYGSEDTINLPSGTITLVGDLPELSESVSIQGQGIDTSIVDGGGAHEAFASDNESLDPGVELTFHGITITGFARSAIYSEGSASVDVSDLEIDGDNVFGSELYVLYITNNTSSENFVNVSNLYIHGINVDADVHTFVVGGNGGGVTHAVINKVTISDVYNTGLINAMIISNGAYGGFSPHTTDAVVQNVTISDISSGSAIGALDANAMTSVGATSVDITASNVTISDIYGSGSLYGNTLGLGSIALAVDPSATADAHITASNVVINNVFIDEATAGCSLLDVNPILSGAGTVSTSLTSSGGNISDDSSCNDYFTDSTDQTEVDPTDLHLGSLGDYGGNVPTIPLEAGSIAIDAGVDIEDLLTDARGVARPQCNAYDSGAYEYDGEDCPEPQSEEQSNVLSTPLSNNTTSYLVLPSGVTNASFSTTDSTSIPTDTGYYFPTSLVSFQFDTTPGNTETITLYFDLPGDPSSYTARKYDTTNHSFSTIQGASITRETYNNTSLLKLTYTITDGDNLDQDHTVNGTIIDPVGLATQSTGSANTGLGRYWLTQLK